MFQMPSKHAIYDIIRICFHAVSPIIVCVACMFHYCLIDAIVPLILTYSPTICAIKASLTKPFIVSEGDLIPLTL